MKTTTTLLTTIAFAAMSTSLFAQDFGHHTNSTNNHMKHHHQTHDSYGPKHGKKMCHKDMRGNKHHKNMSPEKRQAIMQLKVENKVEFMTEKLTLSSEQQTKLREILREKQQKKMQLKEQSKEKIKQILNDEQRAKFESKM